MSECNYSQTEKEALAIIFGIKKFHQYLYDRKFTLVTDHQPLTTIFGPKRALPTLAAAHIQWWAILLAAYNYEVKYRLTKEHTNADALSRLPLEQRGEKSPTTDFNVHQIEMLPVSLKRLQKETCRDPVLSRVVNIPSRVGLVLCLMF